jgi:hypothetical protein
MNNPEGLNIPEMYIFNGYLEAIGDFIIGPNYITWFEAKGFNLIDSDFSPSYLIKAAYPDSKPEQGKLDEISIDQMVEYVNKNLRLPNPPYTDEGFRYEIQKNVIASYWEHLKACIDYDKAKIIEYFPSFNSGDELWNFIFWGFTFLIYNKEQNRCIIIHGGSCD